jgi:hypothetical protein
MKIFVAYPYAIEHYRAQLALSLVNPPFELVYADEHVINDHVLRKIEAMLDECDLALFDLTGANPNVNLELGIAINAKHPYVVAVHKDFAHKLNADIQGWDGIRYETVEQLGQVLRDRIEHNRVPTRQPRPQSAIAKLWVYTERPESTVGGPSMITIYPVVRNEGIATARGFALRLFMDPNRAKIARVADWVVTGPHLMPIYERHFDMSVYPGQITALPWSQITTAPSRFASSDIGWAIAWEHGRFPLEEGLFMPLTTASTREAATVQAYRPSGL